METPTHTAPPVALDRLVMPLECGDYMWDDERVTVYHTGHFFVADNGQITETVEDFDQALRDENSEQNQTSPEKPWLKIGQCCYDECFGHNDRGYPIPNG